MAELRSVKFDDMLSFHFLSRPSFSPDGSKIAYVDARADLEKDGYAATLRLYTLSVSQLTAAQPSLWGPSIVRSPTCGNCPTGGFS